MASGRRHTPRRGGAGPRAAAGRRGRAGAVAVEALAIIPFFLIVWGLLQFVHNYYFRAVDLSARARRCAWEYAMDACGRIPPSCAGLAVTPGFEIVPAALPGGSDVTALGSIPGLGRVVDTRLTVGVRVSGTAGVARPRVVGGGPLEVRAAHGATCNDAPRVVPGDLTREAFWDLTGFPR